MNAWQQSLFLIVTLTLTPAIAVGADVPISEMAQREANAIQSRPSIATNGIDAIAVWNDGRATDPPTFPGPVTEVYASRVTRDAGVDPSGGTMIGPRRSGGVVWNGDAYVVVSVASRSPWEIAPPGSSAETEFRFTSITDAGPSAQTIVRFPIALMEESIDTAWNGTHYLVVAKPRDGTGILGFLLTRKFELVRPPFFIASEVVVPPSVVTNGDGFLVLAQNRTSQSMMFVTLSSGGELRRREELRTEAPFGRDERADAVWNGSDYLVVWPDLRAIRGAKVGGDGSINGGAFVIAETPGIEVRAPVAGWNGSVHFVAFSYVNDVVPDQVPRSNLYGARVSKEGVVLDSPFPVELSLAPGEQLAGDLIAIGETFLVVYESDSDIRLVSIRPGRTLELRDALVSRSLVAQENVRAVMVANQYGFLWNESDLVLFNRMDAGKTLLDGAGTPLGRGSVHSLTASDDHYLAAWRPRSFGFAEKARTASLDGRLSDEISLPLPASHFASDGNSFLAIGIERQPSTTHLRERIAAYLVSEDGRTTTPSVVVPAEFTQIPIGLAWTGQRYFLTYVQLYGEYCVNPRCAPPSEKFGIFLDRSGRPIGSPMRIADSGELAASAGRVFTVAAKSDGQGFFDIEGRFFDENGQLGAPIEIARRLRSAELNVAAISNGFLIRYGTLIFVLDREANVIARSTLDFDDPRGNPLVAGAQGPAFLVRYVEKLAPQSHQKGVFRYLLRVPGGGRSRGIRR
jgi:hypothetical protein